MTPSRGTAADLQCLALSLSPDSLAGRAGLLASIRAFSRAGVRSGLRPGLLACLRKRRLVVQRQYTNNARSRDKPRPQPFRGALPGGERGGATWALIVANVRVQQQLSLEQNAKGQPNEVALRQRREAAASCCIIRG